MIILYIDSLIVILIIGPPEDWRSGVRVLPAILKFSTAETAIPVVEVTSPAAGCIPRSCTGSPSSPWPLSGQRTRTGRRTKVGRMTTERQMDRRSRRSNHPNRSRAGENTYQGLLQTTVQTSEEAQNALSTCLIYRLNNFLGLVYRRPRQYRRAGAGKRMEKAGRACLAGEI